jgi:hypothetical protein
MHIFSPQTWAYNVVFSSDDIYEQVIYTVGRDMQYQNTVVADTTPLVTVPVVVCTSASEIFRTSTLYLCFHLWLGSFLHGQWLRIYGTLEKNENTTKYFISVALLSILNWHVAWCNKGLDTWQFLANVLPYTDTRWLKYN